MRIINRGTNSEPAVVFIDGPGDPSRGPHPQTTVPRGLRGDRVRTYCGLRGIALALAKWEDALKDWLPYGRWECADGRVVLFNRNYEPFWQRTADGAVSRADPAEWVRWERQVWIYGSEPGRSSPWRDPATLWLCLETLEAWGITPTIPPRPGRPSRRWQRPEKVASNT